MEIDLRPDHTATLEITRWEPGEGDKPKIERHQGSWSANGSEVHVAFKAGNATFGFQPQLSFAEFERQGSAPGLVGQSASFAKTLFVGRSLWLQTELKKLKW
jgi:hypothetical protein